MAGVEQVANYVHTTLSASMTSGATSLTVTSATGFPASAPFRVRIEDPSNGDEIVLVTAGAGTTTWTITRAQEGTLAVAHNNGCNVHHVLTAGALNYITRNLKYDPDRSGGTEKLGDDFDSTTLNAGWGWYANTPGTLDLTSFPGFYRVITTGTTDHWLVRSVSGITGDCTVVAKLLIAQIGADNGTIMLGFTDATNAAPTNAAIATLFVTGPGSNIGAYQLSGGTYTTQTTSLVPDYPKGGTVYLRMSRSGTTWQAYFSRNGLAWAPCGNAFTLSLTVNSVCLRVSDQSLEIALDWIRAFNSVTDVVGS